MYCITYDPELYHHGIKRQRWGKRNGPPYPLKPSQHSAAEQKAMKKDVKERNKDEIKKLESDKAILNTGNKIVSTIGSSMLRRKQDNHKVDLSSMSNKELQDRINRLTLEKKYASLSRVVSPGERRVKEIMNIAGDITSVGTSIIALAIALKKLGV